MGQMADYLLNGDDCEWCGKVLGNGQGYPRKCKECQKEANKIEKQKQLDQNKKDKK